MQGKIAPFFPEEREKRSEVNTPNAVSRSSVRIEMGDSSVQSRIIPHERPERKRKAWHVNFLLTYSRPGKSLKSYGDKSPHAYLVSPPFSCLSRYFSLSTDLLQPTCHFFHLILPATCGVECATRLSLSLSRFRRLLSVASSGQRDWKE